MTIDQQIEELRLEAGARYITVQKCDSVEETLKAYKTALKAA